MPRKTARADILLNNMFLQFNIIKIYLVRNLKIRSFLRCDTVEFITVRRTNYYMSVNRYGNMKYLRIPTQI